MAEEICRSLYGSPDGTWALMETPVGTIPPPFLLVSRGVPAALVELRLLGDPLDVVRRLYDQLREHGVADPQGTVARLLGVEQPTVSRYLHSARTMELLRAGGWGALVRADLAGVVRRG